MIFPGQQLTIKHHFENLTWIFYSFNENYQLIVQEHEVRYNVIDYHEYHKTRVPNAGEILLCQMEPENIIHKVCSCFCQERQSCCTFSEWQKSKISKKLFFFLIAETMNSAGENNRNSKTMVKEWVPSNEIWNCNSKSRLLLAKQFWTNRKLFQLC